RLPSFSPFGFLPTTRLPFRLLFFSFPNHSLLPPARKRKSHPVALRHLSHGQYEPDGSHSLAPRPADRAHEQSKFQPVPDGSRGTATKIATDGPIAPTVTGTPVALRHKSLFPLPFGAPEKIRS